MILGGRGCKSIMFQKTGVRFCLITAIAGIMEAGGFHNTFLTLRSNQGWMYCLPPNLSGPFETSSHQKDPCSIRGKPWTSLDHLEVLGISQKFEEAVEVKCLGSKGNWGRWVFHGIPMGPGSLPLENHWRKSGKLRNK